MLLYDDNFLYYQMLLYDDNLLYDQILLYDINLIYGKRLIYDSNILYDILSYMTKTILCHDSIENSLFIFEYNMSHTQIVNFGAY